MFFYKTELSHHYKGQHNQADHGNWADNKRKGRISRYAYAKTLSDAKLDEYNKRSAKEQAYIKNKKWEKEQEQKNSVWAQAEKGIKTTQTMVTMTKQMLGEKPRGRRRIDVSNMTDDELRAAINREKIELEYAKYFGSPIKEEKAKVIAREFFEVAGAVLTVGLTAVQIADIISKRR